MRWLKDVYNAWIVGIIGVALGRFALIVLRPYAVFYNVFAVVIAGGLGMWFTLFLYSRGSARPQEVCLSILTYSLAIVGMSMLDALWREKPNRPIQILSVCIALGRGLPSFKHRVDVLWSFVRPSRPPRWRIPTLGTFSSTGSASSYFRPCAGCSSTSKTNASTTIPTRQWAGIRCSPYRTSHG